MRPIWFSHRETIIQKRTPLTEILVLTSGEAIITDGDGLPVGWLEPGSVFGEEAALGAAGGDTRASASVVVASDRAQVYVVGVVVEGGFDNRQLPATAATNHDQHHEARRQYPRRRPQPSHRSRLPTNLPAPPQPTRDPGTASLSLQWLNKS